MTLTMQKPRHLCNQARGVADYQGVDMSECTRATWKHPEGRTGTEAGYMAHYRAGEPTCDACLDARHTKRSGPPRVEWLGPACERPTKRFPTGRTGTRAGYAAHRDADEDACQPCKNAQTQASLIRRRSLSEEDLAKHRAVNAAAARRRAKENPEKVRATKHRTITKARELVRTAKERPCADCGVQYPYYVMQFDHLDADAKEFNVSAGITRASLERVRAEIAKCDVVCANCHFERTYQRHAAKKGRAS